VDNSIYWHARDLVSVLFNHANDEARICPVARQFASNTRRFRVAVRERRMERSILISVCAVAVGDVEEIVGHSDLISLQRDINIYCK
jgi:hypothetical protein